MTEKGLEMESHLVEGYKKRLLSSIFACLLKFEIAN